MLPTREHCFTEQKNFYLPWEGSYLIVWSPTWVILGNVAKIPPKQVMIDFDRGRYVDSESARCQLGIVEHFEKFKMADKMAAPF